MVKTQDSATIKRTLYFFWQITKKRPWPFALGVIATIGFIGMLTYANTYVMSLIVDRIQTNAHLILQVHLFDHLRKLFELRADLCA